MEGDEIFTDERRSISIPRARINFPSLTDENQFRQVHTQALISFSTWKGSELKETDSLSIDSQTNGWISCNEKISSAGLTISLHSALM